MSHHHISLPEKLKIVVYPRLAHAKTYEWLYPSTRLRINATAPYYSLRPTKNACTTHIRERLHKPVIHSFIHANDGRVLIVIKVIHHEIRVLIGTA